MPRFLISCIIQDSLWFGNRITGNFTLSVLCFPYTVVTVCSMVPQGVFIRIGHENLSCQNDSIETVREIAAMNGVDMTWMTVADVGCCERSVGGRAMVFMVTIYNE